MRDVLSRAVTDFDGPTPRPAAPPSPPRARLRVPDRNTSQADGPRTACDDRDGLDQPAPRSVGVGAEPVAQLPLEDLAVVVRRQGVDEPVVLGPLVPGDVLQARPVEVLDRRRRSAVVGHHEGDHRLAPLRVGPADDGGGPDAGVAQQRLLHLARVDVHPAADDQVLGPVAQREVPVGVEAADVAGVQPAAAQRLGGGLGLVPVAGHDDVAADHHLADLAGGQLAVRRRRRRGPRRRCGGSRRSAAAPATGDGPGRRGRPWTGR